MLICLSVAAGSEIVRTHHLFIMDWVTIVTQMTGACARDSGFDTCGFQMYSAMDCDSRQALCMAVDRRCWHFFSHLLRDVMSAGCSVCYENVFYSYELLSVVASYEYTFPPISLNQMNDISIHPFPEPFSNALLFMSSATQDCTCVGAFRDMFAP